MPAILSRLSILFKNYILSRDLKNTKILLYKLFVRYLDVKPTCVNAALDFYEMFYSFLSKYSPVYLLSS